MVNQHPPDFASTLVERFLGGRTLPQPFVFEPCRDGRSGAQSFVVITDDQRFLLKIDAGRRERWQTTVAIQRAAAACGVAPEVLAVDPEHQAVLSAYISTSSASLMGALLNQSRTEVILGSLVDQVAMLHSIDPAPFERDISPLQRCRETIEQTTFMLPAFVTKPWRSLAERCIEERGNTLCHLDLNPSNILVDGDQIWLVDWDTASPGNRWLDLATIANMLLLSPERTRWMLERYSSACGVERPSFEEFADARRIVYVAYGCAFLGLVHRPPDALPLGEVSLADSYRALQEGRLNIDDDDGRYQLAQAYFAGYWEVR